MEGSFHQGMGIYAFSMHLLEEHLYHNPGKSQVYRKGYSEWVPEQTHRITHNMLQAEFYYCPSPVNEDSATVGHSFADFLHPLEQFYFEKFYSIYTTKPTRRRPETLQEFIIPHLYSAQDKQSVWRFHHSNDQFRGFQKQQL